jgi:hypothetical protein
MLSFFSTDLVYVKPFPDQSDHEQLVVKEYGTSADNYLIMDFEVLTVEEMSWLVICAVMLRGLIGRYQLIGIRP